MTDQVESQGHICPYCQGNGYRWQEDNWQERFKQECPICRGSGKLDAVINVVWKASKE
nr:MAG TPA: Inhibitor of TRAP, regulated by-TRAP, AT, TRAP, tryptophan RNA-binding.06A [Caudoviricetes sp.]